MDKKYLNVLNIKDRRERALYKLIINNELYELSINKNINDNINKIANELLLNGSDIEKKVEFLNSIKDIL